MASTSAIRDVPSVMARAARRCDTAVRRRRPPRCETRGKPSAPDTTATGLASVKPRPSWEVVAPGACVRHQPQSPPRSSIRAGHAAASVLSGSGVNDAASAGGQVREGASARARMRPGKASNATGLDALGRRRGSAAASHSSPGHRTASASTAQAVRPAPRPGRAPARRSGRAPSAGSSSSVSRPRYEFELPRGSTASEPSADGRRPSRADPCGPASHRRRRSELRRSTNANVLAMCKFRRGERRRLPLPPTTGLRGDVEHIKARVTGARYATWTRGR